MTEETPESLRRAAESSLASTGLIELLSALSAAGGSPAVVDGRSVVIEPLEGLRALRRLRELVDELEPKLIARARARQEGRWGYLRRELHSWAEIAEALGVPKQTLHRRYGPGGGG